MDPCEKFLAPCKIFSFNSSVMKNIVVYTSCSRFPVKVICYIDFGSASSTCYLLLSIIIIF